MKRWNIKKWMMMWNQSTLKITIQVRGQTCICLVSNERIPLLCRWCWCIHVCVFSGWGPSEQHPPPPLAAACATGPLDAWDWPACLTNGVARRLRRHSQTSTCQWRRCCPACHSRTQWSPPGVSIRGDSRREAIVRLNSSVCIYFN